MAKLYFHRVQMETLTRFWVNNPTIKEAQLAIDAGAVSCITNPTYASKMLFHPSRNILLAEIRKFRNEK